MATTKKPTVKKPSDLVSSVAKDLGKVASASKKSVQIAKDIASVKTTPTVPGNAGTMVGGTYVPVAGVGQTVSSQPTAMPAQTTSPTNIPVAGVMVGGTYVTPGFSTSGVSNVPVNATRRDAFALLEQVFSDYGIEGLSKIIQGYMTSALTPSEAALKLKTEQAYKDRFKGNELRRARGLNVLSEAEYLNQENTYQRIFASYNQTAILGKTPQERRDYMADLMAKNLDPEQVKDRMDAAVAGIKNADPFAKAQLKAVYNLTEDQMVSFVLAPEQTLADINLKLSAAGVAGAATQYGFGAGKPTAAQLAQINALPEPERTYAMQGIQQAYADELQRKAEGMVKSGVSLEAAREGYSQIAGGLEQGQKIAARYGGQYDLATAEAEIFQRSPEAAKKRKRFASLERVAFGGQSGLTSGSLGGSKRGLT